MVLEVYWRTGNRPEKRNKSDVGKSWSFSHNVCLFCKCLQVEALNHKIIISDYLKEGGDISDPDSTHPQ